MFARLMSFVAAAFSVVLAANGFAALEFIDHGYRVGDVMPGHNFVDFLMWVCTPAVCAGGFALTGILGRRNRTTAAVFLMTATVLMLVRAICGIVGLTVYRYDGGTMLQDVALWEVVSLIGLFPAVFTVQLATRRAGAERYAASPISS